MGRRPLKYVHQWAWQKWPTIQRHLFDGSELKEWKAKGSFADEQEAARCIRIIIIIAIIIIITTIIHTISDETYY